MSSAVRKHEPQVPSTFSVNEVFELFAKGEITEESAIQMLEESRKSNYGILERFASYSTHRST